MMKQLVGIPLLATSLLCAAAASATTTVPVHRFHAVAIEGTGHITFHPGAQQRVVLTKGDTTNTEITVKDDGTLVFKSCPHKGWFGWNSGCPDGYQLDADVTTPGLSGVEIDGSGKINVAQKFSPQPKLYIEINGSGYVDVMNMPVGAGSIAIHGSGKVLVTPRDTLSVEIAGSGAVLFAGNPHVSQTIIGSGEVKRAK